MAIYTHYEVANSPITTWSYDMGGTYTAGPSLITFINSDGTLTKAHGTFFIVNGSLFGGTIGSMERTSADGQTIYESITGLSANVMSFLAESPQNRLDTLFGGADEFYGYSGKDTFAGGAGKDLLVGGAGDDRLRDHDGEADKLIGGKGSDIYEIDALDTVIEQPGEGYDTIEIVGAGTYTIPDNVEKARSYGLGPFHVIGNALGNTFQNTASDGLLEGGAGNDDFYNEGNDNHLAGGEGNDHFYDEGDNNHLAGGVGNDVYHLEVTIDSFHSIIDELPDEGHDTVVTERAEVTLAANVEGLIFLGTNGHIGHGNELDNYIEGDGGQDYLYGHGGNDTLASVAGQDFLYGGLGDDEYAIFAGDTVIELENEGIDTVRATVATYVLPEFVENLTLQGKVGIGNDLNNDMRLAAGAGELHGLGGDDTLRVGVQDGTLANGGDGDDTAVFHGGLADWSALDLGGKVILTSSTFGATIQVADVEHLQFADGTINFNDGSALFDTIYYMKQNPDVFHSGMDALDHYNTYGRYEGRDPNAFFDTSGYLAANPDVAASGMNPLDHYHQIGWSQGRDAGLNFDTTRYLINNPDVAAAGIDPLEHFLQFGMAEGRASFRAVGSNIVNGFDAQFYLFNNADVAAAGVDPLAHFNANGWHEGRNPNAYFDTAGYLATYGDVAAAGVNPLDHYMNNGWQEGRDASTMFDTQGYLAANPDVAAAHVNPLQHFLQFGIYENRALGSDGMWG